MEDLSKLPRPVDDGAADHLPGMAIPAISLPATDGQTVRLDALGTGASVLYLYPRTRQPGTDMPPNWAQIPGARGCTEESCAFSDHSSQLHRLGVERIHGISSQSTAYQTEAAERLGLEFSLLSDTDFQLAEQLGLPTFSAGGERLYRRLTLVVSGGVIEAVFYPVFPPDQHPGEVLEWFRRSDGANA